MGANLPRISIGMPTFNGGSYIGEAIESILGQSLSDIELIISDNASNDDTEQICRKYEARDSRVRYFRQEKNRGAYLNYDFVLKEARAELFMWAADDDVRDSNWLEILSPHVKGDTLLAFGRIVSMDGGGKICREYPFKPMASLRTLRLIQYFLREESGGKANLIYGLFRRQVLLSRPFNVYFGCAHGVDMHYLFDLMQDGTVAIDIRTTHYPRIYPRIENRVTPDTATANVDQSVTTFISAKLCQLLLLDSLKYFSAYRRIARHPLEKMALAALLPVKYIKSVLHQIYQVITRKWHSQGVPD